MSEMQELKEDMKEVKETVKEAVTVLTDLRLLVASDYAKKNDLEEVNRGIDKRIGDMKADIYKTVGAIGSAIMIVIAIIQFAKG